MPAIIRDVTASDLDAVLSLNQSEVPHVGSVDIDRMYWFADNASYFRVAETAAGVAGFLVGFRPGTSYRSPNYRWFCDRYDDFAYVDRVAIATFARRTGLASHFYDDFAAAMPASVGIMTCEVNVRPPNESSMTFHTRLGFRRVGTLESDDGAKAVALLSKEIDSA